MLKNITMALFLLFTFFPAFASQTFQEGVLQAYWLPVWNKNATQNTPQLTYRYFILQNGTHVESVVNLELDKNENTFSLINKYFTNIPEEFFKFKEGHIERAGSISVENIEKHKECDHDYYNAKMVNFTPKEDYRFDINRLEKESGCEAYPYVVTYTLKPESEGQHFKQAPNMTSKDMQPIPSDWPLIKIKTINDRWIKVAIYNKDSVGFIGEHKGYVEINHLQPMN